MPVELQELVRGEILADLIADGQSPADAEALVDRILRQTGFEC
jgi:hypothetical protein